MGHKPPTVVVKWGIKESKYMETQTKAPDFKGMFEYMTKGFKGSSPEKAYYLTIDEGSNRPRACALGAVMVGKGKVNYTPYLRTYEGGFDKKHEFVNGEKIYYFIRDFFGIDIERQFIPYSVMLNSVKKPHDYRDAVYSLNEALSVITDEVGRVKARDWFRRNLAKLEEAYGNN
jgi:hypothetical protein